MADSFLTLADLVKINDKNLADINVTDLLDDAPFMKALAADVSSNGTSHKYVKETGAPVVGFRTVNNGRENTKSSDTLVTIDLKILDASFKADKALADSYFRGAESYIQREALRHLKASFFFAEQQFINGTGNDLDGFTGMADAIAPGDDMTVDAGGSEASGSGDSSLSSVWLVRTLNDGTELTAILGQSGEIQIDESVVQRVEDDSGKHYTAYWTPIQGWLGLQVGSANSMVRIHSLDDATHKLTDNLIYDALSLFPASRQPNLIVMNRRSVKQLRASRTATNATGAPAPRPVDVDGIPIIVTDAITSNDDE